MRTIWLLFGALGVALVASCGGGGGGGGPNEDPSSGLTHPGNVLTVGPQEMFAEIHGALAAVIPGDRNVLQVAPGTYESFTVDPSLDPGDLNLRILGRGDGPVTVDTTSGPVVIRDLDRQDRVEIAGLAIGSAASTHPAVLLDHAKPSVVVLDSVQLVGGAGQPGVRMVDSQRIAVQRSGLSGSPALLMEEVSIAVVTRSSVQSAALLDRSFLRTASVQLGSPVSLGPQSLHRPWSEPVPVIETSSLFPTAGAPATISLTGEPGLPWFLGASPRIDWFEVPEHGRPIVGLVDVGRATVLQTGTLDATGEATATFGIPETQEILGVPVAFQAITHNVAGSTFRWSNVISLVPMP